MESGFLETKYLHNPILVVGIKLITAFHFPFIYGMVILLKIFY